MQVYQKRWRKIHLKRIKMKTHTVTRHNLPRTVVPPLRIIQKNICVNNIYVQQQNKYIYLVYKLSAMPCHIDFSSLIKNKSTNEDYNAINAEHSFNLYVMIGIMCMWMVPQRSGIYSTFDVYAFIHGSEISVSSS